MPPVESVKGCDCETRFQRGERYALYIPDMAEAKKFLPERLRRMSTRAFPHLFRRKRQEIRPISADRLVETEANGFDCEFPVGYDATTPACLPCFMLNLLAKMAKDQCRILATNSSDSSNER